MFGSNILDIAIGMIFVYLLLSLICSAANEIIEGWLKNRATDLERGIRELLDPNSKVANDNIVAKIYKHPLINGLYKGLYEDFVAYHNTSDKLPTWLKAILRWFKRIFTRQPELPSYIPARNFALALMDTVLPANQPTLASPPTPPPPFQLSGTAGATQPATPLTSPPMPNPLEPLRAAISDLPDSQTKKALLALVDAAGNDVNKARENIETWFNSSMDRVSGWYKKRSQFIIFILGFGVAVALNADSVTLVKRLSTDKTLRDSLVASAEAYAKATPTPPPTTGGPAATNSTAPGNPSTNGAGPFPKVPPLNASQTTTTTTTPASPSTGQPASATTSQTAAPKTSPPRAQTATPATGTQTAGQPAAAPSSSPANLPKECKDVNDTSPECRLALNRQEIEKLSLPIGWGAINNEEDLKNQDKLKLRWPGWHSECFIAGKWERSDIENSKCQPTNELYGSVTGTSGWLDQFVWHWLGWLITALAVSLGAPFWFDLLNKFIVVRSTVKPHEKSPEEGSKA